MPPTLSQLQVWDTDHLTNAATYWAQTADRWEDIFIQVRNQSQTMGWEGQGGDALRGRTNGDLTVVSAKADQLRNAAKIARSGASDVSAAQRRVLYGVEDAQNAGFTVTEDLSVIDTHTSSSPAERAARQVQAEAFAADIRQRAAQLEGTEATVSGQLTAATTDLGSVGFERGGDGSRVHGHWYQAQWQEYQYQLNTIPVWQTVGPINMTLPDMSYAHTWQPVTLGQLMQTSTVYPEATIHLPNLSGDTIDIKNGWWAGGLPSTGIPTPPVMTRGH